jgi:hypothetical protein
MPRTSIATPALKALRPKRLPLAAGLALALVLGACGEREIEEHVVPKGVESIPPASAPGPVSEGAGGEATEGPWALPEGWRLVPGERPMRLATFEAPDESGPVEVALTRFPGDVGGVLANINRWRGQMGLGPVTEGELEALIDRFEAPGFSGYAVRIEGAEAHMLAVGVYEAAEDRTWFVRATLGPDAAGRLKSQVLEFARSLAGLGGSGDS